MGDFTRRGFIAGSMAGGAALLLPAAAFAQADTDRRLLFILQRGAADGIGMLAPLGDPDYLPLRRGIAEEGGHAVDPFFSLHPALTGVARLAAAGEVRFHPAVATGYRDRSHFDAQNMLEGGGARPFGRQDGWVNRLLTLLPEAERSALAIAEAVPLALRGSVPATSYAPSRLPAASDDLMMRVSAMYESDAQLHGLWQMATQTRMQAGDLGGNAGRNGARLGQLVATLMGGADGARVAMVETGGWDTHSGQRGRLAAQLRGIDALIDAVRTGLGPAWQRTLVIVATEFGRTAAVNGTGGTDHGTASLAMLLGGGLGRDAAIAGDWPGLSRARLYEGRDLAPTASLERTIAGAVARHYDLDPARVQNTLYPALA